MRSSGGATAIVPRARSSHKDDADGMFDLPPPTAPAYEQRDWCAVCRSYCSRTTCCACCAWCDMACALLALYTVLLAGAVTLHAAGVPALVVDDGCPEEIRTWVWVLGVGGAAVWGVVTLSAACFALGRLAAAWLAALALLAYTSWGWVGVVFGAIHLGQVSTGGSGDAVSSPPPSNGTAGHADATVTPDAACGEASVLLVLVLGAVIGAAGLLGGVALLMWRRMTRWRDSHASCYGCCYLGACIPPGRVVEATKDVVACYCCRCQVATDLPPPKSRDFVSVMARKQFVHAEACLPCADQVSDPDKIAVRTYGGAGGVSAMRSYAKKQRAIMNRARERAGKDPLPDKGADDEKRTESEARRSDPSRSMKAREEGRLDWSG